MKKRNDLHRFLEIGVFLLLALLIFNSFFVFSTGSSLDGKIEEAKELAKPVKIEIIKLKSSCLDCFDIDRIIQILEESDLEILNGKSLSRDSQEAEEIINKYNIEKLPTVVLKGETEKASIQNFKQVNDALVFDGVTAPYEDVVTKKVVGKVSSIIISDNKCDVCSDFGLITENLKQNGVFVDEEKILDFLDPKAKELINKFDINRLPALLLSKDIDAYPNLVQNINQLGLTENNGYYVIESQAPYVEAETGDLRGLVSLTMISDESCAECYDVEIHKQILTRFGLVINKENKIDISSNEGGQLINKYVIKSVPTVILTGDLDVYTNFGTIWQQAGSVEDNGAYVFRNLNVLGRDIIYKDITTNEIINN